MTKQEVLDRLNISQAEMARMFGVTRAAVTKWPDNSPLPEVRWLQLKYHLRPDLFGDIADPPEYTKPATKRGAA